jgi:predicted GIY-YIG superfamily endonuclease
MNTDSDSTILEWHGLTTRLFPATHHYVYLLHFHTRLHHAGHYLGSSSHLDTRLALHKSGNGARLMEVVSDAGISWELARLWECDCREASLALERKLKHRHESPRLCPLCRGEPVDLLVSMREGHPALSIHEYQGRRRPMALPF